MKKCCSRKQQRSLIQILCTCVIFSFAMPSFAFSKFAACIVLYCILYAIIPSASIELESWSPVQSSTSRSILSSVLFLKLQQSLYSCEKTKGQRIKNHKGVSNRKYSNRKYQKTTNTYRAAVLILNKTQCAFATDQFKK